MLNSQKFQFSSVAQSCPTLCDPMNCSTPGLPVHSRSSLRLTSIEPVMPSSHLILCPPLLLLPRIPPSIRIFSNEWSNQIPCDYTVEVRSKFQGLDLIDRVTEELWMEVRNIVHKEMIKTIPPKKKRRRGKTAVWGGLTNCEKKGSKKQRTKGKIYPFERRVPKNSKER